MQVKPERLVVQWLGAAHASSMGLVVQLGTVPPVMGMVPQQTSPEVQSVGSLHGVPPPELEPESPLSDVTAASVPASVTDEELLELHAPAAKAKRERTGATCQMRSMAPC
jgi:hypothetical protein